MKKIQFGIHVNRENNLDKKNNSITKCIQNSILHASAFNLTINIVSIFISNPRGLQIILKDEELIELQQWVKINHFLVVAHSSYVAYLWNKEDPDKYIDFVLKEYNVCKQCGIKGLVVHLPKESILKKQHIKQTFVNLIKHLSFLLKNKGGGEKDKTDNIITDNIITDNIITDNIITDNIITDSIITDNITGGGITDNIDKILSGVLVDDTSKIWSVRQELEGTISHVKELEGTISHVKELEGTISHVKKLKDITLHNSKIKKSDQKKSDQKDINEDEFFPIIYLETPAITPMWANYDTPEKLSKLFRIIHKISPNHPFGLCIDTAHIWTSGNDISTYNGAKRWFTELMDAPYIPPPDRILIHLNDSARELGRGPDKHAPLTHGYIWGAYKTRNELKKSGLYFILQFSEQYNIPIVLERSGKDMLVEDYKILSKII